MACCRQSRNVKLGGSIKVKKVCVLVLAVIVMTVITGCSSVDSFEKQVKSGNYSNAIDIFTGKIVGHTSDENEAISFLNRLLDDSFSDYTNGKMSKEDFYNIYTTLKKINDELHILNDLDTFYQQYTRIQQSKESFLQGVKALESSDFVQAIEAFSDVVKEDTENYANAQRKLTESIDTYQSSVIANAKQLAAASNYDEAIRCVEEAEDVIGYTDELEEFVAGLYTQKYFESMSTAYSSGDYISAIKAYLKAKDTYCVPVTAEMTNMYSSSVTNYMNAVNSDAETAFGSDKDYAAAIAVLRKAISEVEYMFIDDLMSELETKVAYYQEFIPVLLTSLEYTQKARYISIGDKWTSSSLSTDTNGVSYDSTSMIYPLPDGSSLSSQYPSGEDEAYVLYNLNYKYGTLTGVVFRPKGSLSATEWGNPPIVKIYGDEVLLYEAPAIYIDSYDSYDFSIDVAGVRNLKIVMIGRWSSGTGWIGLYDRQPRVCLGNLYLQK